MSAINRFNSPTKFRNRGDFLNQQIKCIFISYQRQDKIEAKKVADYLIGSGINVYFDEYDIDLKMQNQVQNPTRVTDALCKGINNSSHMLVIVSPSTIISKWVPFEIGYGFEKTDLAVLCLKNIGKGHLPEYIRTAKIIRDIYDVNSLIANLRFSTKEALFERRELTKYNNWNHPLVGVMDDIIHENYS